MKWLYFSHSMNNTVFCILLINRPTFSMHNMYLRPPATKSTSLRQETPCGPTLSRNVQFKAQPVIVFNKCV